MPYVGFDNNFPLNFLHKFSNTVIHVGVHENQWRGA